MDVDRADEPVAAVAAAIGEPARTRMLYCLMDGRARTSTELAVVADVAPSTASVHLQRLRHRGLVEVHAQGRHRYYRLTGPEVAAALEALSVLAGERRGAPAPSTPHHLRAARTCYDHLAGTLGVALLDRFRALEWLSGQSAEDRAYTLTPAGDEGFEALGVDLGAARRSRRRLAFACLDWSERRPHLGGALGAAVLALGLAQGWVSRDLDSRAVRVTRSGRRALEARLGLTLAGPA
ncbi:MAG: ArsR/SmtB family transcription factor [Thermoanaerobaculia bacterium]